MPDLNDEDLSLLALVATSGPTVRQRPSLPEMALPVPFSAVFCESAHSPRCFRDTSLSQSTARIERGRSRPPLTLFCLDDAGWLSRQSVHVSEPDGVLQELLDRCRRDHLAWINGDANGYALPEDGTILGAVGGHSFGGPETAARQSGVARQWRSGSGELEYLNGGMTDDVAWLAFIERAVVVFTDDPTERRWDLRVTEVFRRSAQGWERVHRHADPLVDRRPVPQVAALLD